MLPFFRGWAVRANRDSGSSFSSLILNRKRSKISDSSPFFCLYVLLCFEKKNKCIYLLWALRFYFFLYFTMTCIIKKETDINWQNRSNQGNRGASSPTFWTIKRQRRLLCSQWDFLFRSWCFTVVFTHLCVCACVCVCVFGKKMYVIKKTLFCFSWKVCSIHKHKTKWDFIVRKLWWLCHVECLCLYLSLTVNYKSASFCFLIVNPNPPPQFKLFLWYILLQGCPFVMLLR